VKIKPPVKYDFPNG